MKSTNFFHIVVKSKFHTGKDKDGSVLIWEKLSYKKAVCVEARGRFSSRWIGVVDNFFTHDRVWGVK